MLEMYARTYLYMRWTVRLGSFASKAQSLLFVDSAVIPTGSCGAASAFDISQVNIFISA